MILRASLILGLLLSCELGHEGDPAGAGVQADSAAGDAGGDSGDDGASDGGGDGGFEDSGETGDSGGFCADAPTLTWANFGNGFLIENCQGCHASTAADRHDAPEEVCFDTVEQAWSWASQILALATGDEPTMPPTGGVFDDDRQRLEYWLRCAEPGT